MPLLLAAAFGIAHAQSYTFKTLHPAGYQFSQAEAISYGGVYAVGEALTPGGWWHAVRFGPGDEVVDLHPAGWEQSYANSVSRDGLFQAGFASNNGNNLMHAFRWSGSGDSGQDLNPWWCSQSLAYGISADGSLLAGVGTAGGIDHALLWNAGKEPWVRDLQPAGFDTRGTQAHAISADGSTQVGILASGGVGGGISAVSWRGTGDSFWQAWSGAWTNYRFCGVSGEGRFAVGCANDDSSRWGFWADLNQGGAGGRLSPGPCLSAYCFAISANGKFQAGYGEVTTNVHHALLWEQFGAVTDLHAFAPSYYSWSEATGVDDQGNVCGRAYNADLGRMEAVVWLRDAIRFEFVPDAIAAGATSQARVMTTGELKTVIIRAESGQGVPTAPIKLQGSGSTWTATVPSTLLAKRTTNPVRFTAYAHTSDSGTKTASATLAIVESGTLQGVYGVKGNRVTGIVCDNPAGTEVNAECDKLELRSSANEGTAEDASGSVCLNGTGTSTDQYGDNNAGRVVVFEGKAYYLPPSEFNLIQRAHGLSEVTTSPLRFVTVKPRIRYAGGKVVQYPATSILLARPAVVLVHGINNAANVWQGFVVGANGIYLKGPRFPIATASHWSREKGNGPVEYGAMELAQVIRGTVTTINSGSYSYTDSFGGKNGTYSFRDYLRKPLSCTRVDVVAHSYGGLIARWYLASDGSTSSLGWYRRAGTDVSGIVPPTYGGNVRKLITLGSMWRGVPLCNYVNEVNFKRVGSSGRRFGEAPMAWTNPLGANNLEGYVDGVFDRVVSTKTPAMEVMACEGPWLRHLLDDRDPFVSDVAYGSVAGHLERYYTFDEGMYGLMDLLQVPTWFAYLRQEWRQTTNDDSPGYSDGLVPVWSGALPGSAVFVQANHSSLPGNADARSYVLQWLSNGSLPSGTQLNAIWRQPVCAVDDPGSGGSWSFLAGVMTPVGRYEAYEQSEGIGRLNPFYWGP